MLKLENIQGGYIPGSLVLQGIDLEINPGEVVGIIGLNGCGKSTLGKAVMNMLPHRYGKILFKGQDVSHLSTHRLHKSGIGMVMQGGRVFPHMTVWEHFQLAADNKSEKDIKKRLAEIAELSGLSKFVSGNRLQNKGSYLSGGEKQQLALILALLNQPQLLILDEISAGQSSGNVSKISVAIENLKSLKIMAIILIEQNIRLAAKLSERLLLLERGIIDQQFVCDETFDFNKLNENIFN